MAKSGAVNPFAAAKQKPVGKSAKPAADIIPAQDFTSYDGAKYTGTAVQTAIENYIAGKEQADTGDAMMKASRPTLMAIGRTFLAKNWLAAGTRPHSPLISVDQLGRGSALKFIVQDSVKKLDENSYAALANLISASNAEKLTVQRDDFAINSEVLGLKTKVKAKNGAVVEATVMDAMIEALQEKFGPSPEILASLFTVVHKFETVKGLIDKGPSLVKGDQALAQFLEVGGFVHQLKPSGGGE